MMEFILLIVLVIVIAFVSYVATRPKFFTYSKVSLFQASPEKIYPYISQLKLGDEWLPYGKKDPAMRKNFTGTDGTPGARFEFEGNKEVGAGVVEILKLTPNKEADLQLYMMKPFKAENLIRYKLEPVGDQTRFTWSMEGENGFLGKLIMTLIDCEKLMGKDMNQGFENLRKIVE